MNMETEEFKSRLAECSKYLAPEHVLTPQSVNELFATITLFFSGVGKGIRGSPEAVPLKKESLRLVRCIVDRLLSSSTSSKEGAIVAACQQLRALDRLVEDDLILLVVV
jgi:hypothetical protein